MLDAQSGRVLRTVHTDPNPNSAVMAVDPQHGRVLVAMQGGLASGAGLFPPVYARIGHVMLLDARSGRLLRTIPVGVAPSAVAVDEQTGHAFVLNAGGLIRAPDTWGWLPQWLRRWLPFLPPPGAHIRTVPGSVSVIDAWR